MTEQRVKHTLLAIIVFFTCLTSAIVIIQIVGLAADTIATHYHLGRCA